MKNLTILLSFFFSLNLTAQKWINDSNCDEQSYEILNEAITHLANIEQLTALGMAKAAKISDSGCECANLVIAAVSSSDANWGSRKEKFRIHNTHCSSSISRFPGDFEDKKSQGTY